MASKAEDVSSNAEAQYSLRCSVCLDDFKEPKVLPCCHTFCKHCLEKISTLAESFTKGASEEQAIAGQKCDTIQNENAVLLTCPQCRAQHKLMGGGVDALLTDYAIEDELYKVKSSYQEKDMKSSLRCGLCESTDPVVVYCEDCSFPLCEFCHKAHQRLKPYNGHSVKPVNEIDSNLLSRASKKHLGNLTCSKHPIQVTQIFCSSCDELVCCECVIEGHEGHRFVGINSETRYTMEKKLSDTSSVVRTALEVFKKNLKYVETVEKVTNEAGVRNQADIKTMFDDFISILQKRRDDLLVKSEERNNAKLKLVWSEKDFLEQMVAKLSTTLSFSKRLQTCKNDGEYLLLACQALLKLKELEVSSWDSKTMEEMDLCYLHLDKKANEPMIFQTAANFDERRNQKLKLEWKNFPVQVNLGEKHVGTFSVTRDDTEYSYVLYNMPSVTIQHVESVNCPVADASIDRSTTLPGTWDVTFTPYCGGRHTCVVIVGQANTLVKSFDVTGMPPLNSKMMRGPSWTYSCINHNYGASKTEVGVVTSHDHDTNEQRIGVQWPDGEAFRYRWGTSGMFDVQLYH